ncbi:MAG: hypothetical protein MJZ20_04710 [Bacteroidaceae bacterium]|nr:hypothetical protein [Bacteroidaceae bacterium]
MKLLIQISISGFKIFDTATFPHKTDVGSYALMSEINETQKGNTEYRTHITRLDSHGIPSSILSLFSTSGVDFVLQDMRIGDFRSRLFYVSHNGITHDFHGRRCEVSFMLISENNEEIAFINKFAALVIVKQDSFILSTMQGVLTTVIRNEEVVLEYNAKLFQSITNYVNDFQIESSDTFLSKLACDTLQYVVVPDIRTFKEKIRDISGCFNNELYCVLNTSSIPLEKHSLSVNIVPAKILGTSFKHSLDENCESHNDIIEEIIGAGKKIYDHFKNNK